MAEEEEDWGLVRMQLQHPLYDRKRKESGACENAAAAPPVWQKKKKITSFGQPTSLIRHMHRSLCRRTEGGGGGCGYVR